MGHSAVPRRSPAALTAPRRLDAVGAGWTGRLTVSWSFARSSPLVVGSGRLVLAAPTERRLPTRRRIAGRLAPPPEPEDELLADVVRGAAGMPVIPGSSLKGAVRQVYELLTPSCDVNQRGSCTPKAGRASLCPACSLFGGRGWAARVGFLEAAPDGERWPHQLVRRDVPQAWTAQEPKPRTVRLYGAGPARDRDGNPAALEEKTFAVHGTFTSRVRVLAADDDELGLLFAALGIGCEPGPGLRLGGRKFHGFGAAAVRLLAAERWRPWAAAEPVAEPERWAVALRDRALDADPGRRAAWKAVHEAFADPR